MIVDADHRQRIRDPEFARLMEIYSENYRQLSLLFDDLAIEQDRLISRLPGELPIYFEIIERHRYTTFARLTYFIEEPSGRVAPDPDAHLRIYHDARLAEATHCYPGTISQPLFGSLVPVSDVVDYRWRMNRFLDKWLEYLLRQGHGLDTIRVAGRHEWPIVSSLVPLDIQRFDQPAGKRIN